MTLTRGLWGLGALAALVGLALAGLTLTPRRVAARSVPTARVTRGPLKLDVHATGELRAGRVASLAAPPVGGTLRLVRVAGTGTTVRAGDVVMEFDPAEQQYALEQARSELAEAEQEIVKMRADVDVQAAQDQVDLLAARFDVRRAELEALSGESFIGAIEAKKRALALEEAKRRLAQLEEDVRSRAATSRAALTVVDEKRNKARLAAERAQQIIDSLMVPSPLDGLVVLKENRDASGGFFFSGMSLPEYRAGDNVFPGRPVLDVFASGDMEVKVKVNEQERANVAVGQGAAVLADALPGRPFSARVAALAGLATRAAFFESGGPLRLFDVTLRLDRPDARLRPGTSVRVVVTGSEVRDALVVPRQALFQKNGKPVVYVRAGERFEAREVKVTHRTESRIALEGLAERTEVALVNPEAAATGSIPASGPLPTAGGPR
jgi:HlyD family secretion protein